MNEALLNLKARGFFAQCTDVDGLSALMDAGPVTFYVGCDPTGPSAHIGHLVPFFAFRHLRLAGHRGIALMGGGTARIGDPSGKTTMRRIISYEEIDANTAAIACQIGRFLGGFDDSADPHATALLANNKDWLANLNYIDFLRDIGAHFSVNRMLSFEAYRQRMETGLSFIEFNYQLLQSYDFLQLHRRYGCRLQIGGDDQWGNIVAGADLIRRVGGEASPLAQPPAGSSLPPSAGEAPRNAPPSASVYGLTFPLVTTSDGKKMGKTEKGALFLDPEVISPYEFFQYWRNVQDADIERFLLMFTFLPVEDCRALAAGEPNAAKERLAWEVTSLVHGADEADRALAGAKAAFSGAGNGTAMPTVALPLSRFESGYNIVDLFCDAGLCPTKSEARRLVQQGGAFAACEGRSLTAVTDVKAALGTASLTDGALILRAGKKRYCRVTLEQL